MDSAEVTEAEASVAELVTAEPATAVVVTEAAPAPSRTPFPVNGDNIGGFSVVQLKDFGFLLLCLKHFSFLIFQSPY